MNVETSLVPWIIKQTQKGPPDAWFGKYYTLPLLYLYNINTFFF